MIAYLFFVIALITNSVPTVSTTPNGSNTYAFGINAATRYNTNEIAAKEALENYIFFRNALRKAYKDLNKYLKNQ